jgi:hypothetical protein
MPRAPGAGFSVLAQGEQRQAKRPPQVSRRPRNGHKVDPVDHPSNLNIPARVTLYGLECASKWASIRHGAAKVTMDWRSSGYQ